jgi:hypothetical protein
MSRNDSLAILTFEHSTSAHGFPCKTAYFLQAFVLRNENAESNKAALISSRRRTAIEIVNQKRNLAEIFSIFGGNHSGFFSAFHAP